VGVSQAQTFNSGSNGSDGALNLTTPGTIIFDPKSFTPPLNPAGDNVYNFTTINIAAGVTVKLTSKVLTGPVYWLATGDVTIGGIVDLSGETGHGFVGTAGERIPAAGGAGGYLGGVGGSSSAGFPSAEPGNGPGGGPVGTYTGPFGRTCTNGGTFTGSQFLIPLVGGSGGSGGSLAGSLGAGGGGGGGAILIASSTQIRLLSGAASILANGGAGGAPFQGCQNNGDGGPGSGGAIRLIAPYVNGGTLSAYGGNLNATGTGYLGNGVIRVEAYTFGGANIAGGVLIQSTPFSPAVPVTPPSSIKVTSIVTSTGTIPINANPFSFPDATINTSAPVTVNVQAQYVPLGTVPKVLVISETGPDQTVNCSPLAGTLQQSTCSASITFPTGGSRGFVKATWTQ